MSFQRDWRFVLKPGVETMNICSACRIWCFVDVIWYFLRNGKFSMQIFFTMEKLLGGHAKTSVISLSLKIIIFHSVSILKIQYWINSENFVKKCQVIIGIHYCEVVLLCSLSQLSAQESGQRQQNVPDVSKSVQNKDHHQVPVIDRVFTAVSVTCLL